MTHTTHRVSGRAAAGLVIFLCALTAHAAPAVAQTAPVSVSNPRAVQAERPTVATHAYSVAPGYLEIETGFQRQPSGPRSNTLGVPILFKIGLGTRVQLDLVPGWQHTVTDGSATSAMTDSAVGMKWRLIDESALLGAFAVQATASFPTGSREAGTGGDAASFNVLAISSRNIGPVALDLNAGYTRHGGDGTVAPNDSTVWTVSAGFPVVVGLGWVAEVFGYPATKGPGGAKGSVGFLTGPTFTLHPAFVLDVGAVINITGLGDTAVYAGLTWNVGRLWGPPARPARRPRRPAVLDVKPRAH